MKPSKYLLATLLAAGLILPHAGCAFFTAQRVGTFVAKKAATHVGKKAYKQFKEDQAKKKQSQTAQRSNNTSSTRNQTQQGESSQSQSSYHTTYKPNSNAQPMRDPVRPNRSQL